MSKIKVAVLFGGKSTEHEVSCKSVFSVIKNIDSTKYEVVLIGLAKNGDWLPYNGEALNITDGSWEIEARKKTNISSDGNDLTEGLKVLMKCDVVFPVIHGLNCEDGTVQGLLELIGKPYVGCNVLASAVGMDKAFTKIVFEKAGIPQCKHIVVHRNVLLADENAYLDEIEEMLAFPCFVKPSNSGSSVGVYKVKSRDELRTMLLKCQEFDRKVIVEECIFGREVECAVLGNLNPIAATPGEVKPSKEFYDYEDKYQSGTSTTVIPAQIPVDKLEEVKRLALAAYKALDCSGLSRVDFFYRDKENDIILNEINTLPGFTEISMYSKLWAAEGVSYTELLTRLIELAYARKEENKRMV